MRKATKEAKMFSFLYSFPEFELQCYFRATI